MPLRVFPRLLSVLLLTLSMAPAPAAAQDMDPAYRFRTVTTEHFTVYFHQGADGMAAHLADIAESTWRRFEANGAPPPARTHVVLVDQSEAANGFATPLPRNTIVLYAARPPSASLLNPTDWLRTLFEHEFTHIVHLDRADGWARLAQRIFGRAAWAFPNVLLPAWQIEGLATWQESVPAATARPGRLHAGDFQNLTLEAARTGSLLPLDRAGGGLTDWPGGLAPYAYGLSFHDWLADRYGAASLWALSDATARSLPWLGTRAFARVYGRNLGRLWADYQNTLETSVATPTGGSPSARPRRLTRHGFDVSGPRFLPGACDSCPASIAYTLRTPHDRPGIHVVQTDTLVTTRLTTRYLGQTLAPIGDRIYFDQQEVTRNTGLYSDLYAVDRRSGRVSRLTWEARLMDPDVSPDGRRLVAVQHGRPDRRDLVIVAVTDEDGVVSAGRISTLASAGNTHFNAPRWSPDGRLVVAGRQPPHGSPDLVVIDVATGAVQILAAEVGFGWATPTWRPDGRALVAAGSHGDGPFDLYEIPLDGGGARRLTHVAGGAVWPELSPDGSTLVYVGYTTAGFDLYETPYAPSTVATPPLQTGASAPDAPAPASDVAVSHSTYRPWTTLLPTSWTPMLTITREQIRAGAAMSGRDILGYHAWGVSANGPLIDRESIEPAGRGMDWFASYVYGRWRPQIWAALSRDTSLFPDASDASGLAVASAFVERTAEVGVQLPLLHVRASQAARVSLVRGVDTFTRESVSRQRNRSGIRLAWRFNSAQRPGYAISPERGLTVGTAAEFVRPSLGASGRGGTVIADARAYAPGLARHHVVAIRTAGGFTWGDDAVGRLFVLGGGQASADPGQLTSDTARLLRGFPADTFAGRQIAVVNVDYRFPLARPQRGVGAWPLFLHSVHAAVIADAGHVWDRRFDRGDIKYAFGAELSARVVLGYQLPLTLTGGVARGHDGNGAVPDQTTTYGRIGYAF